MATYSRPVVIGGMLVGVAAVGTAAILIRLAIGADAGIATASAGHAPPLAVAFWRTVGGALALAPFAARERRRSGGPLPPIRRRQLAASGFSLALHFALWLGSLALTTVASSVTLVTMSPIFVALGARRFLDERTPRRTWIGMTITIVGAVLIGVADASAVDLGPRALLGDVLAFGGAVAITGYLLIGRVARRDVGAATYAATVYTWAAIVLLPVCLLTGTRLTGYSAATWLAVLGVVVGPQLLGHTVFNALLSTVPPTIVSTAVVTEPLVSTLLAWFVLSELPAPLFWLGAPFVLAGVVVATWRRVRRPPPPVVPGSGNASTVS